jgi:UDP-N-acetylglucosamine 2-epimerase (non-hydrolysing)
MKTLTLLGTRPELIKLSEIIKALDRHTDHVFVHTGQNYDYELNEIFYQDLALRQPDYYLGVGGGSLAETIAKVLTQTELVLQKEQPDAVVILGDTNSALGGLIAKRMKIPLFHLEAGNRCFDPNVPEEINRTILDHLGDVNMVYSENSRRYLLDEGVARDRIFLMGSPMREVLEAHMPAIMASTILSTLGLKARRYFLVSLHRDENTTIDANFETLMQTLDAIAAKYKLPIVVSTHPRTRKKLEGRALDPLVRFLLPFGFLDYVKLQMNARCVVSDSGTIAEESGILHFPAVTIRNAVERPEAVDAGSLLITGVDRESILHCLEAAAAPTVVPQGYEIDDCSKRVVNVVLGYTPYINKYVWHKR